MFLVSPYSWFCSRLSAIHLVGRYMRVPFVRLFFVSTPLSDDRVSRNRHADELDNVELIRLILAFISSLDMLTVC